MTIRVGKYPRVTVLPLGKGARVYSSIAFSCPNGVATPITFDTVRFDNDNCWNAGNPSYLLCNTPGIYVISGAIAWAGNATGARMVGIQVNGIPIASQRGNNLGAGSTVNQSVTAIYSLAVGDYAELYAIQNSGGNLNVNAGLNYSPEFAMIRIGDVP